MKIPSTEIDLFLKDVINHKTLTIKVSEIIYFPIFTFKTA